MPRDQEEIDRLRREFDALPKVPGHGDSALRRHSNIRPEWVMQILREPYHTYEELSDYGERDTVIVGRVPQLNQWIKIVFIGEPETGAFLTVYNDRRLEDQYGGRPWDIQ